MLETTKESGVDIGSIRRIAITRSNNNRVDTSGVAVPDLNHSVRIRITGRHVDNLGVKYEFYTLLILNYIFADIFARYIVRVLCHFRREDAGVVASEQNCSR